MRGGHRALGSFPLLSRPAQLQPETPALGLSKKGNLSFSDSPPVRELKWEPLGSYFPPQGERAISLYRFLPERSSRERKKKKTTFSILLNVSINVVAALLSQDLSGNGLTGWSLKLALVEDLGGEEK